MNQWTPEAITEVAEIVNAGEYTYYGIRCMTVEGEILDAPVVGEYLAQSYHWDDGERLEETVGGTCGIEIRQAWDGDGYSAGPLEVHYAASLLSAYYGRWVVLMAGHSSSMGDDQGETIISDAVVLAVFDRGTETCDFDIWGHVRERRWEVAA